MQLVLFYGSTQRTNEILALDGAFHVFPATIGEGDARGLKSATTPLNKTRNPELAAPPPYQHCNIKVLYYYYYKSNPAVHIVQIKKK